MKRIRLIFILSLFVCVSGFAQDMEKRSYENGSDIGGDVAIKSSNVKVENGEIYKTFEIESLGEGSYYLDAWIIAPFTKEGYSEYKVAVNDILTGFSLKPQTDGWHSLALTDARKSVTTIRLEKGENTISVIGKGPEVPNIEFVKLSSNLSRAGISDTKYRDFVESIESNNLNDLIDAGSMQNNYYRGTNGEIYDYCLDMPVLYTTYYSYIFSAGQVVTILTNPSLTNPATNYNIEFFNELNSKSYSWHSSNISGSGNLTVTIPAKGGYRLCIRVNSNSSFGLVDVSVNGQLYTNCIASCSSYAPVTAGYPVPSNFFTCKIKDSRDTWLMLENSSKEIRGFNDNYLLPFPNDYSWGNASRITTDLTNISQGHVFSASSYNPFFECDLYLGLESNYRNHYGFIGPTPNFPNLALDNSFISGEATLNYDTTYYVCYDWSVGKKKSSYPPNLEDGKYLSMWDEYYFRYGYIPLSTGENVENASIAIWGTINGPTIASWGIDTLVLFSHAGVRKNSKNPEQPHGFEWESKMSSQERIMHTKDALSGGVWGNIIRYYKPDPSKTIKSVILPPESTFSTSEMERVYTLKNLIPDGIVYVFEEKYHLWEKIWSKSELDMNIYPLRYTETTEYKNLLKYCMRYGKVIWPLLFDKLSPRDVFVINLLKDITCSDEQSFFEAIKYVRKEGELFPTTHSVLVDYCKKLLAKEETNILNAIRNISAMEEGSFEANISTNAQDIQLNLYSAKDEKAGIKIYNVFGGLEYEENYGISKGNQTLVINASNLNKGIYIVKITIGSGESISQTISL